MAVDVMLSPKAFDYYGPIFTQENLPYIIIQSNVQQ